MNKIYLVIIDFYYNEENSIVDICSSKEKAEELKKTYENNCSKVNSDFTYHIEEVDLDSSKEILWDCYGEYEK